MAMQEETKEGRRWVWIVDNSPKTRSKRFTTQDLLYNNVL